MYEAIAREAVCQNGALQKEGELAELLELLHTRRPKTVLKIGTYNAQTVQAFARATEKYLGRILVVDTDGLSAGVHAARSGGQNGVLRGVYNQVFLSLAIRDAKMPGQNIDVISGDPRNKATFHKVVRNLWDRGIDFLFLDGSHALSDPLQDVRVFEQYMSSDGIVGVHDVLAGYADGRVTFSHAWEQMKREQGMKGRTTREIIHDPAHDGGAGPWGGIGLLFYGN